MTETRTPLVMSKPRPARSAHLAATAAAVVVVLLAPAAVRAAGPKRAGVPKFDGAQEALVRKQVMQQLKAHGYELAKSREMDTAMQNTGALLESDDGFQKVAKELALTVIVTGEVGKKRAKITIHDGREGSVLGEASFPGPNPKKIAAEVGKTFWSKVGEDIARGHMPSGAKKPQKLVAEAPEDDENAPEPGGEEAAPPPPEGEPKPKKRKNEEVAAAEGEAAHSEDQSQGDEEAPKKKKKKKKHELRMEDTGEEEESGPTTIPPTLDIAVAPTLMNRSLTFTEVPMNAATMRAYSLPAGFTPALDVVMYPFGALTDGPAQNIGFEVGLEQGFFINSSLTPNPNDATFPNGATFGTSIHQFEGGVRYRIPFGVAGHQVWFSFTGGEHAFLFTSAPGCQNNTPMTCRGLLDIPDTIYRYIRPGIGARFELPSDFSIAASAGFRYILNDGGPQIGQFFPHRTVYGADADLYVGYRVIPNLEIRAGGSFRQYGYAMHSTAADLTAPAPIHVAGGAVDRYISGMIAAAFVYGGTARPEAPPEEEAPPPKKKKKHHRESDEDEGGGGGEETGGGGGDADQ
jgi:hypothetical protein